MRKGSVAGAALQARPVERPPTATAPSPATATASRHAMLSAIQTATQPSHGTVVIATTGYTGRELYACEDRVNQLYMVGSMGCAVSLGLGLALACPDRRVVVIDGDGAALMRLGAQAIVGYEAPPNLVHVLLDNAIHESTGGQATVARSIDFGAIAAACGYAEVHSLADPAAVAAAVAAGGVQGPVFIHAPITAGVAADLPRPVVTPPEVCARLRAFLQS
jgi:phosphonopyruvate decarboxylase